MSAIVLAFIGDAVETLCVRTDAALSADYKVGELQRRTAETVNARAQSIKSAELFPKLNEDERAVYMRARNGRTRTAAKNAELSEYKKATAYEAVLGFLYITGQRERICALLDASPR
jgi:ribonuclease-3 family protein